MKLWRIILCVALLGICSQPSVAQVFERDRTYEQALKFEASADQVITPARFFQWVNTLLGNPDFSKPSNIEFQPIVNIHDSRMYLVGAIAFKF